MESKKPLFVFAACSGIGGLASFLDWLGIKPKDLLGLNVSLAIPHWVSLAGALLLFAISFGLSAYGLYNRALPLQSSGPWKPKWQKLQWANAERQRLEAENARLTSLTKVWEEQLQRWKGAPPEITEEMRQSVAYQNKLIDLGRSIEGVLNPLQIDSIQLSTELIDFLRQLGPAPLPKYTAEQIANMTSAETGKLLAAHDGDFAEACEYHQGDGKRFFVQTDDAEINKITANWIGLLPWYQKLAAGYALNIKGKVETLRHRFAVEGISDGALLLPVEGRDGQKHIRSIAAKLWELAYKAGEKDRNKQKTEIQKRPKRIEEL